MRIIQIFLVCLIIQSGWTQQTESIFFDGYTSLCEPQYIYDFSKKSNRGKINIEDGFWIQCHMPLYYSYWLTPNIKNPNRDPVEVGIPQKTTFYYKVDLKKKKIQLIDCFHNNSEFYEIYQFSNKNKEFHILAQNQNGSVHLKLKGIQKPVFSHLKFDSMGSFDGQYVHKSVRIYRLKP